MNTKSKIVDPVRGLSTLMRPTYSPGLLLQDDDLTQAVNYTRQLSRLMFRTLFGCGVMCGLVVDPPTTVCGKLSVTIHKGVALDCSGDPIEVPQTQTILIDFCTADGQQQDFTQLWFVLCPYDKCCGPRTASCSSDEPQPLTVCTRERDGFEIRVLQQPPDCACGCESLEQPSAPHLIFEKKLGKVPSALGGLHVGGAGSGSGSGGSGSGSGGSANTPCQCLCVECQRDVTNQEDCYYDHYAGNCNCDCCDCDCVVLAVANQDPSGVWTVDHSVRRFVRPVLMRDPQVAIEQAAVALKAAKGAKAAKPAKA
jgi:hypothetical protein